MSNKQRLDFHTATGADVPHVAVYEPDEYSSNHEEVRRVFDLYFSPREHPHQEQADEDLAIKLMHVACAQRPATVMLDVSTAHMPESVPDFGGLLVTASTSAMCGAIVMDDYGYVVWVGGRGPDEMVGIPEWFHPLYREALECGAVLICFDRDSDVYGHLPTWEW